MNDILNWDECKRKHIINVEVDNERILSIKEKTDIRLKRAKNTNIDKDSVSLIVEDYYEVIKELLLAYLLKNGLRSKNHKCLISYFYHKNPDNESDARLISRMSYLRNRLTYYGESIEIEFYDTNKKKIDEIIKLLGELINIG